MEKSINKKLGQFIITLKDDLKNKIIECDFQEKEKTNILLEYLNEYERCIINKDDLIKRSRIKNNIPNINRCIGILANGKQCTRQKKNDIHFCGTHEKYIPFGSMEETCDNDVGNHKIIVFAKDIKGIIYYLDNFNNVYRTEDIIEENKNPTIIAKYTVDGGEYHIPDFGI